MLMHILELLGTNNILDICNHRKYTVNIIGTKKKLNTWTL